MVNFRIIISEILKLFKQKINTQIWFLGGQVWKKNIKFNTRGANMEILMEKAKEYIIALMEAGSYTVGDVANMSGVPASTVTKIIKGKTEKNPGFPTIVKIILALGGDLNELVGYERKKEIEVNSAITLKETYEMRIADITKACDTRIEDIKALCETRIEDILNCCEKRIEDILSCCEKRIADIKEFYESRITSPL